MAHLQARLSRAAILDFEAPPRVVEVQPGFMPIEAAVGRFVFQRPLPPSGSVPKLEGDLAMRLAATESSRAKPPSAKAAKPAARKSLTSPPKKGAGLALAALATATAGALAPPQHGRADMPLAGLPPRFEREFVLSELPAGFEFPLFFSQAWQEHTGEIREAKAALRPDVWHCSIADRRTMLPPAANAMHFICSVAEWVDTYPLPLGHITSHYTCSAANRASSQTWREKVESGEMLAAAEGIAWQRALGATHTAEQPDGAHEHLLGPPCYKFNLKELGGQVSKTWCLWTWGGVGDPRHFPVAPPTPDAELVDRGGGKTKEQRMLSRSPTPRPVAASLALAADFDPWSVPESERAASAPCTAYAGWLADLEYRYAIFAARYAPTVTAGALADATREQRLILGVPVSYTDRLVVMIPLEGAAFGIPFNTLQPVDGQAERLRTFLPGDVAVQGVCYTRCGGDFVCALPCTTPPLWYCDTPSELAAQRRRGASATWCTLDALASSPSYEYAVHAVQRISLLSGAGVAAGSPAGRKSRPVPVVSSRAARSWRDLEPSAEAAEEWQRFIDRERERGEVFRAMLEAAGEEAAAFAPFVRTAADYEAELPIPAQGLPTYTVGSLLDVPYPSRPLPLCKEWLTSVPPQVVPPGCPETATAAQLVRAWGRRRLADAFNASKDIAFECYETGDSAQRSPDYLCLGMGASCSFPHADGIGRWKAWTVLWERRADGLFEPMRWHERFKAVFDLQYLFELLGLITDQEILSFVFEGMRWKVCPPRQIRIGRNVTSSKTRMRQLGQEALKLAEGGYASLVPLLTAEERFSADGLSPLASVCQYVIGIGGIDKDDHPDPQQRGVRKVGNTSDPHPEDAVYELNEPHPAVWPPPGAVEEISFNEMTGPRKVPDGVDRDALPWGDPECKSRPREAYAANAVLQHLAFLAGTFVCGWKDDASKFFWQFRTHPSEWWLSVEYLVVPLVNAAGETVLYYCALVPHCMNMGTRPASKVACRFMEEFIDAFRAKLDAWVAAVWLPRQRPALQQALAHRAATLGPEHGRPYYISCYTDDVGGRFCCPWLGAEGGQMWRQQCHGARLALAEKAGAGTVLDMIGAREVFNGGFGCLVPSKRDKCIDATSRGLRDLLDRDEFERNNSFIVHAHDITDMPAGTTAGMWAPLQQPGVGTQPVILSLPCFARPAECYAAVLEHLRRSAAAPFWCAVSDAPDLRALGAPPVVSMGGDACTPYLRPDGSIDERGSKNPNIFGGSSGVVFRVPIVGALADKHITVLEAFVPALNLYQNEEAARGYEIILEGDASAAGAMLLWRCKAPNMVYMRKRLSRDLAHMEPRLWQDHTAGWNNGWFDAGSRGYDDLLADLSRAYGVKVEWRELCPAAQAYVADVVANTSNYLGADNNEAAAYITGVRAEWAAGSRRQATADIEPQPGASAHATARRSASHIWPSPYAHPFAWLVWAALAVSPSDPSSPLPQPQPQPQPRSESQERPEPQPQPRPEPQPEPRPEPRSPSQAELDDELERSLITEPADPDGDGCAELRNYVRVLDFGGAPKPVWERAIADVARHLGVERVQATTLPTAAAAVTVLLCPDVYATQREAWEAYGASERSFVRMLGALRPLWERCEMVAFAMRTMAAGAAAGASAAGTSADHDLEAVFGANPALVECAADAAVQIDATVAAGGGAAAGHPAAIIFGAASLGTVGARTPHPRRARGSSWEPAAYAAGAVAAVAAAALGVPSSRRCMRLALRGGGGDSPLRPITPASSAASVRSLRSASRGSGAPASPRSSPASAASPPDAPPTAVSLKPIGDADSSPLRLDIQDRRVTAAPRETADLAPADEPEATSPSITAGEAGSAGRQSWSPQPLTADDARKRAALELATRLSDDTSPYALMPAHPDLLKAMCIEGAAAAADAIPTGTLKNDRWGFGKFMAYALWMGTPWMRPRHVEERDKPREVKFAVFGLQWCMRTCRPSSRNRRRGVGQAQPSTPLQAWYGFARVLRDCGRYAPSTRDMLPAYRAMRRQFLKDWGARAMIPIRGMPLSKARLLAISRTLGRIGGRLVGGWTDADYVVMSHVVKNHMSIGHRADETRKYCRSDFRLFHGEVELEVDAPNLHRALSGTGYMLCQTAVNSKCDPDNTIWGGRKMWMHIDAADPHNSGAAWARYELRFPCPADRRGAWPAFSPTGDAAPFTESGLRAKHEQLMRATGGPVRCEGGVMCLPTLHWYRITLATQLMAQRNPDGSMRDGVVQAHLRWRTAEAMEIYARYSPQLYADEIREAQQRNVSATSEEPPIIDPIDMWNSMLETEIALEDQATAEAQQSRKRRGRPSAAEPTPPAAGTEPTEARPTSEAPPTTESAAYEIVDFGEGVGEVRVSTRHALRGAVVEIPYSAWGISTDATSLCEFVGYSSAARRYALRSADDGFVYPFTAAALRGHLSAEQRGLL